jgi:hypothetical protein
MKQTTSLLLCCCASAAASFFTAAPSSSAFQTSTTGGGRHLLPASPTSAWRRLPQNQVHSNGITARSLFFNNKQATIQQPIETEEEKQKRLKQERIIEIEAGELRRQQRVSEDKLGYLFLFALQFLPLLGSDRYLSIVYFFGLAVTTVYLGGRQEVIDKPEKVSKENALYAPWRVVSLVKEWD